MSYYDIKLMSGSRISKLIGKNIKSYKEFLSIIDYKEQSQALNYGTIVHEYLLENKKDDQGIWKEFKFLKPFIDSIEGQREVEIFSELEGIKVKSKVDILGNEIYDLKTSSSTDFKKSIETYGYKYQMAFYELLSGKKSNFIFVNKNKRKSMALIRNESLWREKQIILDTLIKYKDFIIKWSAE